MNQKVAGEVGINDYCLCNGITALSGSKHAATLLNPSEHKNQQTNPRMPATTGVINVTMPRLRRRPVDACSAFDIDIRAYWSVDYLVCSITSATTIVHHGNILICKSVAPQSGCNPMSVRYTNSKPQWTPLVIEYKCKKCRGDDNPMVPITLQTPQPPGDRSRSCRNCSSQG